MSTFISRRHPPVWLNQVEIWFGILSRKALRGASFKSVSELRAAIQAFVAAYGPKAKPLKWRKREVKGSQLRNTIVNLCTSSLHQQTVEPIKVSTHAGPQFAKQGSSTTRNLLKKAVRGCPLLRASNEHSFIVRVLRAKKGTLGRPPARWRFFNSLLQQFFYGLRRSRQHRLLALLS